MSALAGVAARARMGRPGRLWRRLLRRVGPSERRHVAATRAFVAQHGLTVRGGPFVGLRYVPEAVGPVTNLLARLRGDYEQELHTVLRAAIEQRYDVLVDIGAADGYYAVGFAIASPVTRVVAVDIDPQARALCERVAAANGVTDRVEITDRYDGPLPRRDGVEERVLVMCDCEGCEIDVLSLARSPYLAHATVIVELHDFVDPSTSKRVLAEFAATHEAELIAMRPTEERRRHPVQWAVMVPKAS